MFILQPLGNIAWFGRTPLFFAAVLAFCCPKCLQVHLCVTTWTENNSNIHIILDEFSFLEKTVNLQKYNFVTKSFSLKNVFYAALDISN